jgi:saccharopine dehydrogenase-like NADP-dependent oxidoreductase
MSKKITLSSGKEFEIPSIESLKVMRLYGDEIAQLLNSLKKENNSEIEMIASVARHATLFTKLSSVTMEELDEMGTADYFLLVTALLGGSTPEEAVKKKKVPVEAQTPII